MRRTPSGPGARQVELVGRTLEALYGPQAWAIASSSFAAAFEGRAVSYERRLTHQGASARWTRALVFPDRNDAGEIEAVYTIAFDIHDDVVEREALHAARKRLDRFTEHIPYPLAYVDSECTLRFVNRAFVQTTGLGQRATDRPPHARRLRCRELGPAASAFRARAGRCSDAVHAPGRGRAARPALAAHQLRARLRRRRRGARRLHRDHRRA